MSSTPSAPYHRSEHPSRSRVVPAGACPEPLFERPGAELWERGFASVPDALALALELDAMQGRPLQPPPYSVRPRAAAVGPKLWGAVAATVAVVVLNAWLGFL